jgi:predicted nucleotidyltransferase component of viral defense system
MREQAVVLAQNAESPAEKLNILREYLQVFVMRSLHESEAYTCLSFVGGTALRFAFDLPRFSEDLDFSLENPVGYEPVRWMEKLKRDMTLAGFDTTLSWNDRKTVNSAWIKVAGLLKEAGLSAMSDQNLSIKLEIDSCPPAGAESIRTVINRHFMFAVRHHSLPSLMAGKIHALMTRKYSKGRDWYDMLWYLSRRPSTEPNLTLLQNALDQTQGVGTFRAANWRETLSEKVQVMDFQHLLQDVEPFLERPQDARLLTAAHFQSLLPAWKRV